MTSADAMLFVASWARLKSRAADVPTEAATLLPSISSEMNDVPSPRIYMPVASPAPTSMVTPGSRCSSSPGLAAGLPNVSAAATVLKFSASRCCWSASALPSRSPVTVTASSL
jgi:hypothetical protein